MDAKERNNDLLKKLVESYRDEEVPVSFEKIEVGYQAKRSLKLLKSGLLVTGTTLIVLSSLFVYFTYLSEANNFTRGHQSLKEENTASIASHSEKHNEPQITSNYTTFLPDTTPSIHTPLLNYASPDKMEIISSVSSNNSTESSGTTKGNTYLTKTTSSFISEKHNVTHLKQVPNTLVSEKNAYPNTTLSGTEKNTERNFVSDHVSNNYNERSFTNVAPPSVVATPSIINTDIQRLQLAQIFLSADISNDAELRQSHEEITTGITPSVRNIRFTVATEADYTNVYSSLKVNNTANSIKNSSELESYTQQYIKGMATGPFSFISGRILLGLKYKNWGVQSGISYFSKETAIQSSEFALKKPVYVFDHYIYDTASHIIDTAYKVSHYNSSLIVNGDSVKATSFLNHLRFVSIPVNVYRSFNLYRYKFFAEPQAGIQVAIPLPSYQLIMEDRYRFRYTKTKDNLRKVNLFGEVALRLRYKLSASTSVYVKQGFYSNPASLYKSDYYTTYKLNMSSTSVGIIIQL
ncbi:MAG: hypothetical protein QM534_18370 [Sediminibacterium sp.]|nr:hypothetical protein [Sediminibacterium sp.]